MAKMSANKTSNGNDRFSSQIQEVNLAPSKDSLKLDRKGFQAIEVSKTALRNRQAHSQNAVTNKIEVETELLGRNRRSVLGRIKARTAAMLIGSAVMLPILATSTATYYFGNRTIERQTILAKRANNIELAETELARAENLLAMLLIGTGITALLAGSIAAWIVKRLLEKSAAIEEISEKAIASQLSGNLVPSVLQQNILEDTVEEARSYLKCDRAIVYSLNRDDYGKIVAESVAARYTRALGKTIFDPCLADKYLQKYQKGEAIVIDDLESVTSDDRELNLEVKANLAVPIINENKLLGLLVAHQCEAVREWQQSEIRYLRQLARKTSLAWENAELQDNLAGLQASAERERQWTNYFSDAVRHIHQSIAEDNVLEISVEEVRRVLGCDRVVVYSQGKDKYGVVVAESVLPGYPRALNKTIEVAARSLEEYRDGEVRAIDDIYEVGISQQYIEPLETLQVKANLITPILVRGELFGLLVAHQCSASRHWLDYETRWISKIATQVGFALDNAKVLAESAVRQKQAERERQWTNYFTEAVRHIHQSIAEDNVLEISVEEVRRVLECDRVVVYSQGKDNHGVVVAESVLPGYPRALNKTIEVAARSSEEYRNDEVRAIDDIYEVGISQQYIEPLETLQVKANLITPILVRGELFGLLVAHQCSASRHWLDYETHWMSQIATQVGFALDNATLLKESASNVSLKLLNDFSFSLGAIADRSELRVAVEQVRQILELDRTIIYQFDSQDYVNIAAESVVAGYPKASDSSDNFNSVREYDRDKIRAIANITSADLTDSDLKRLKSLSVRAILEVPISLGDRLFGLLVGYQCQQPRSWSSSEIDLFTQLAVQLGFAFERIKLQQDRAKYQLESLRSDRQSELTVANESTLQAIEVQNELQLAVTDSIPDVDRQTLFNGNLDSHSEDLTAAGKAISKALDEVKMPNSSPNLDLAVDPIDDTPKSESDSTSALLPTKDIAVTADEISLESLIQYNLEPEVIVGQLVESSETPNSDLMNQFVDEMSDLSKRVSQQSLFVTESFQKLAEFAKQLSERKSS